MRFLPWLIAAAPEDALAVLQVGKASVPDPLATRLPHASQEAVCCSWIIMGKGDGALYDSVRKPTSTWNMNPI